MTWEFDAVDSVPDGDFLRIDPKNCIGHLLLVWAVDYIEHSPTRFTQPGKMSDVIIVDAVDLSVRDPESGQIGLVGRKCWWRQAQIIRDLKESIGKLNPKLVMMDRGRATKGQPPYVLIDMRGDANAVQQANAWRQANPNFTPSTPSGAVNISREGVEQLRPPANLPQETELEKMARMAQHTPATAPPAPRQTGLTPPPPPPPLAPQYPDEPPF